MSKWDEDYFWYCSKCGAISPKLEIIEEEFQLFDNMMAHHKNCGGNVGVLRSNEYHQLPTITEFKMLPDKEREIVYRKIQSIVNSACNHRREIEENHAKRMAGHVCPRCNSILIEKISTSSRVISTTLFGLASSKIGKQYVCKTCGHKW